MVVDLETRPQAFHQMLPNVRRFRGQHPRQAYLNPMLVGGPGERWAIDLTEPRPTANGYTYMFTDLCCFSKFGGCIPIRNKEASTVAKATEYHIILRWGMCHEIVTDLRKEFQAELLNELLHEFVIIHLRSRG